MYNNNYKYNANNQNYKRAQAPYNNNMVMQQQPVRPKGGCSSKKYVPTSGDNKGKNMIIVNGWKKTKTDFLTIKCNTTSKSAKSEKGWIGSIACTVTSKNTGQQQFYWGSMHADSHMVKIDTIGLVLIPKNGTVFYNFDKRKVQRRY